MLFIFFINVIISNVIFIFIFRITESVYDDYDTTEFNLRIIKINSYFYGNYVCEASNTLRFAETQIGVYGKYCFHKRMHKI